MRLSEQQVNIINWTDTGSGHLNVHARAGCGKTTLLVAVTEHVVRSGMGNVFLGAYNKAIASEIKLRLEKLGLNWQDAEASTLHAAGFRLCRAAWRPDLDENKVRKIVERMARLSAFFERNARTICSGVSLAKQTGIGVLHGVEDESVWLAMFEHYGVNDLADGDGATDLVDSCMRVLDESNKTLQDTVDFDDMVYGPLVAGLRVKYPYQWVLLDECQDVNATRRELALRLLAPGGRFIAVGDSYQSIYGFTGADSDAMELVRKRLDSATLPLTVTYRCPKAVVKEAQRFVPDIVAHESAPEGEVLTKQFLLDLLPDKRLSKPGDIAKADFAPVVDLDSTVTPSYFQPTDAILCRNTAPLVALAYKLIRKRIACRVEGRDIGISLRKLAEKWKVKSLAQLVDRLDGYLSRERARLVAKDENMRAQQVEDKVTTLLTLIELCTSEGKHQVEDLFSLIDSLFSDSPTSGLPKPLLTLSTVHKAKGREWDRVFILDRERYMPSRYAKKVWEMQQENNLQYVAATRAKQTLVYLNSEGRG